MSLSIGDGIVLITQSRTFKVMYLLYIISHIVAAFISYVVGSSLDNPCDRSRLLSSMNWFGGQQDPGQRATLPLDLLPSNPHPRQNI